MHIHNRDGFGNVFACDYTIDGEQRMRYRNVTLTKLVNLDQQIQDRLEQAHPGSTVHVYHVVRCIG